MNIKEQPERKKMFDRIRKWLPIGYAKIIHERTGKSFSAIYGVVSGKRTSEDIYNALLELALENKKKIEEREKLLETL